MVELHLVAGRPAHGGSCVSRHEGRVVFTRLALPGEQVRAEVLEDGEDARFWRAEALEVVDDSNPGRVTVDCPLFRPDGCGGCSWLHASPELELEMKAQILRETLHRIGGIAWSPQMHSPALRSHWRTKVTLHVDDDGHAGFHGHRSHRHVTAQDCLQADLRLNLPEVLRQPWPPGATVQVSVSDAGRSVVVRDGSHIRVEGPETHVDQVLGRSFRHPVRGFWQSHVEAAEILSSRVIELAADVDHARVLDLYSGVGLFGLTLRHQLQCSDVLMVEGDKAAVQAARRNAGGDRSVRIIRADVKSRARTNRDPFDLVVLDPPRAGAGKPVLQAAADTGAETVIYVSCEPSTLARDLAHLREMGFVPDHIEGHDIFPGTAQMECVVRLRRGR